MPDLWKLRRLVRAASRGGTLRPRGAKALWITEISWDSRPPDPDGVPAGLHARWLADALFSLWRQGASTLTWLQVGDAERGPGWEYTYQSGVYLRDGRPKPAAAAFRFPLVVDRRGRRRLVWGRAPGPGTVTIERRAGSRWRRVARLRTSPSGVFEVRLALRRGRVRARLGHEVSMARSVGRAG